MPEPFSDSWYLYYVLLSSMRFLIKVTLLSIYSAIFVSWLVGQSIQANQMAQTVDICQSVGFETAFKYSLKTPFIFKGSFLVLMRTLLPTTKKVPFSRFWRDRFKLKKIYLFGALKFCLVKWEMNEKWTILTSKYFHSKA